MKLLRSLFCGPIIFITLIFSFSTFANEPVYTSFYSNNGLSGYDTVAYFELGKPTKGKSDYQSYYNGANWLFSSKKHLELFEQDPEKYLPQYGGYCAWGVAHGYLVSSDPTQWRIVNGKLYTNYNRSVANSWKRDSKNQIIQGDINWPNLILN
ncbi:YHS domain-containing protein [Vibrio sp.]|nr:YHS domain-containing protein [Vibrio sp.]